MAGTSRKQNNKETEKRGRRRLRRQLAKDPRVTELLRKRWGKLRSLASDDKFRDETARIRKALETAYEHNPEVVEEFFKTFWYPSPANFFRARQFLEAVRGARLRETCCDYLAYASRFGVYMTYWKKHRKFRLRILVPNGPKFHVRIVGNHLVSKSGTPEGQPFVDYFANDRLKVPPVMEKQLQDGAAKVVQIEDNSFSTVLSELEEFAYFPDAITFIRHKAERTYLFCLVGERVTQPDFREAGTVVSAMLREDYGRGPGRPRDRLREKKALNLHKKSGPKAEIAHALAKGDTAKDHFSAERYARQVKKRNQ